MKPAVRTTHLITGLLVSLCILTVAQAEELHVLTNSMPPIKYMENGGLRGVAADVLTAILATEGLTVPRENMHLVPWKNVFSQTMHTPGCVALAMARTPKRESSFKWVGPIYTTRLGLIGKIDRHFKIYSVDGLRQYRIGTFMDSTAETLLLNTGIAKDTLHRNATAEQAIDQLVRGEVDLLAFGKTPTYHLMQKKGINPHPYEMVYEMRTVDLYIAFNIGFDDALIARLQRTLDSMKEKDASGFSQYDRLVQRHFAPDM